VPVSPASPLRRHWPAVGALLVGAALWAVDTASFAPLGARYRRLLVEAGEMGATFDPRLAAAPLPPRVTDLFRGNSLTPAEADRMAQSGFLATDLVRRVSAAALGRGIEVSASQPGSATQTTATLEVRAQLVLEGRYEQVVELLDDLAREGALYRIEELSLAPQPGGRVQADLQLARMLLKRGGPAR
jgi:hypothetical protein